MKNLFRFIFGKFNKKKYNKELISKWVDYDTSSYLVYTRHELKSPMWTKELHDSLVESNILDIKIEDDLLEATKSLRLSHISDARNNIIKSLYSDKE